MRCTKKENTQKKKKYEKNKCKIDKKKQKNAFFLNRCYWLLQHKVNELQNKNSYIKIVDRENLRKV